MIDSSSEIIIFNYILKNTNYFDIINSEYFENNLLKKIFEISKKFYKKFGSIPSSSQIKQLVEKHKFQEFIIDSELDLTIIDKIYEINLNEYDQDWITENFQAWAEWKTLNASLFEVIQIVKTSNVTTENIKMIVEKIKEKFLTKNSLSFDFKQGLDIFDEHSHKQNVGSYFSTGYDYFNKMLGGGFQPKTLIVVSAAPKMGKSLVLQNFAANGIKEGKNVLYVSLELSEKLCVKRIGSNILNIPIKDYDAVSKNTEKIRKRISNFKNKIMGLLKEPGRLFVKEFPTGTMGTPELEQFIIKLEEHNGLKIDLLIVDYLNIMKNYRNPNSENLYIKGKVIAEDLRAISIRNNLTILTAVQLNREGSKSSSISMSDISESMGVVHTTDGLFAIVNRDSMDLEKKQIRFKALALRNAEYDDTPFAFNLDLDYMRIEEKNDGYINKIDYNE